MFVYITGGVKNGKSGLGQKIALKFAGNGPHYYIATMIPVDDEDKKRIRLHIEDRDGLGFKTVECGRNIESAVDGTDLSGTFLLDSITALYMNELFSDSSFQTLDFNASKRCIEGLKSMVSKVSDIVMVSDYIFSDACNFDGATEAFREGLASIDRAMAEIADVVIEVAASDYVFHKGSIEL